MVIIRNQHPDIELTSPVYFCKCGKYYKYPIERTDDGTVMKIDFRPDFDQDTPGGILIYKVQRKRNAGSNHQSNIDNIYDRVIEETSERIRLLIAWKIKRSEKPKVKIVLVEYDNHFVLNESKLAQLYDKFDIIPSSYYENTWSMYDNTVLKTTYGVIHEDLELKITISEGIKDWCTMPALWINLER
jgi:hypothetical protein